MSPLSKDSILLISLKLITTLSIMSLFFIFYFLIKETLPFFTANSFSAIFTDIGWHPTSGQFLMLPMIFGSLIIMIGAMLVSVPLGIFAAILSQFYSPKWFSQTLKHSIEVLAGIPSVIYGFWGIIVIVPLISYWSPPGTSVLAGIIVLSFIVLPNIFLIANNALSNIDKDLINNAMSLGLSRQTIIFKLILPDARASLSSGIILQSGRAIGETLAVLMVCGNVVQIPSSIFDPVRTLTSNIALEMAYAMGDHRSALFLSGLLLVFVVLFIIVFVEKFLPQHKKIY